MLEFDVLFEDLGFTEGPVIMQNGSIAVVCTLEGIVAIRAQDGVVTNVDVGGGPNGAAENRDGTLYIAQNGGRRPSKITGGIQAVRPDGSVEWVTMDPVAPNDLCFGPDGALYV